MTVTLSARAEELLRRLTHLGPPEEIIQTALEKLANEEAQASRQRRTPVEALERILELENATHSAAFRSKN